MDHDIVPRHRGRSIRVIRGEEPPQGLPAIESLQTDLSTIFVTSPYLGLRTSIKTCRDGKWGGLGA